MNNNHLIIMAGGVGSRFWPMSTPEKPKQFIDVLGIGKSLIQLTVERFKTVIPAKNVWIVTSEKYKSIVREQLPEVPETQILLEPCMRNTAPCIEYVSRKIYAKYPEANLVFSPADHIVLDVNTFRDVIKNSLEFTENREAILTLGMMPTRPETGYGYIKRHQDTESPRHQDKVQSSELKVQSSEFRVQSSIFKVEAFKEKPNLETAKSYLSEGGYYWNAGIFIWNAKMVVNTIANLVPELSSVFDTIAPYFYTDKEQEIVNQYFPTCPNISIDYAVMEKSKEVYVYPANFGWSDLGTWGSLYTHLQQDENNNASVGENINLVDCKNCIVHTPSERRVVVQGLDNYIIAESDNTLLICRKEDEQNIKDWQK
ncbi:MAG: mannose-1-phosphate guanylyltransferase [Bacteroidales bacterium]|nr:mannose-1-phosphate guanylyltransferase [Bacteroidales bacterium]